MKRFSFIVMVFYLLLIFLLAFKSSGKDKQISITKDEVIRYNFYEPKDFADQKNLQKEKKEYYEYLYKNTKQ